VRARCARFHPYLVITVGDTYPLVSNWGLLRDAVFQPKCEEDVFQILLTNDFLGNFHWFGGISCGVCGEL
jgi:hypothetical protein